MVEISKPLFEKACSDACCTVLVHPWDQNCLRAMLTIYKTCIVGSARFYSIVYLVQILYKGKKILSKQELLKMGEYYVRSTLFGALVCANITTLCCILRWFSGGKFLYYNHLFIPSFITGLFIYLEPLQRRGLVINLFSNLVIEYWLRTFERSGYLTMTTTKKTSIFMIGSALLFYLMRLEGDKDRRTPLIWLFTPEKVRKKSDTSENICPHDGTCGQHIWKGFYTYFGAGLALKMLRFIIPMASSPFQTLSRINASHFKMAMFFGGYVSLYRAVICYLCRKYGHDSALFALPAGFIAGISFIFSPSLMFSIASITAAFKVYSTILYEKKILSDKIPLPEILYCFVQGLLFHARFMHPEVCPQYVFKLTDTVSSDYSRWMHKNLMGLVKNATSAST